jgi:hypothetical protein
MWMGCSKQESLSETPEPALFEREFPVTEVASDYVATQRSELFEIVPVQDIAETKLDSGIINQSQTFAAFNACTPQSCKILVEELATEQVYELTGPFLSWRPISDQVWLTDEILGFDQWSNPHYGTHYEIDFVQEKIIFVSVIAAQ